MALVLADRVKETTTTAGTGTVTLLGAATGFQSFGVIGDTNLTYYCIAAQAGTEWEVGIGTYTLAGTTLARTTVLSNSAGTQPTALTFSAGTKDVFVTYPVSQSVYTVGAGNTANTANGLVYANSSGVFTTGTALAFDGANVTSSSFLDTGFTLKDNADPTKIAVFELSGLTTGVTRTYTLPNSSGVLASLTAVQTFTTTNIFSGPAVTVGSSTAAATYNIGTGATIAAATKAINIGTNGVSTSITNIAIGSAVVGATTTVTANGNWTFVNTVAGTFATANNLSGGSAGTLPYQSATGTTAQLAVGTAGQLLQSNGAAAPSWVTNSAASKSYAQAMRIMGL